MRAKGLVRVGVPTEDLGVEVWNEPNEDSAAVGDERGFLIVIKSVRPWYPTGEVPRPRPVVVSARGARGASHPAPDLGCRIENACDQKRDGTVSHSVLTGARSEAAHASFERGDGARR